MSSLKTTRHKYIYECFFLEWLAASRHNKNADLSQQHHFTHSNYFLGIFVLSSVFAVRHWVYFTQKPRKLCLLIGQSKFQPNKKKRKWIEWAKMSDWIFKLSRIVSGMSSICVHVRFVAQQPIILPPLFYYNLSSQT